MKIAVNTRFLLKDKLEGLGWFTHEVMQRIVKNHPEHEFHFFFDRAWDERFIYGPNVVPHKLKPQARHPILWHLFFQRSVKKKLKKIKADLFFSTDGFATLKCPCPQVIVIHDIAFEHFDDHVPPRVLKYYRKYTPQFAEHADKIITVSEFSANDIKEQYAIPGSKIKVCYNGVNPVYQRLTTGQKEMARQKYGLGEAYFLFIGALQPRKNLVRLIEAFDRFKKKSGSETKLVVIGGHTWIKKQIDEALEEAEFGHDVRMLGHLQSNELISALGGCLALCYVSLFEGFGIPIVEAMHAEVSVITSKTSSMPEIAGKAALLVDPESVDEIAEAMWNVYENKYLIREHMIAVGKVRRKKFSWDKCAEEVWNILMQTSGGS